MRKIRPKPYTIQHARGKSPSSNNYQKLCRKTEIRECHCKTRHRQPKKK